MDLLNAVATREEQQFGSVVIAPPPCDWNDVLRRAVDSLGRSLDLRLAIILVRANLRLYGWAELAPALGLASMLLEHQWEGVHPLPDKDAPSDHIARANALSELADPGTVLADLRASTPWEGAGPTVMEVLQTWDAAADEAPDAALAVEEISRRLRASVPERCSIVELWQVSSAAVHLDRIIKMRFRAPPDLTRFLDITQILGQLPAVACGDARPQVRTDDLRRSVSSAARDTALAELRTVTEWLNSEGLTDRIPVLLRQAERLRMPSFGKVLADVVPNATNPLAAVTDSAEES